MGIEMKKFTKEEQRSLMENNHLIARMAGNIAAGIAQAYFQESYKAMLCERGKLSEEARKAIASNAVAIAVQIIEFAEER